MKPDMQMLKMIGGGAIILAAFLIMMPDMLNYLRGLGRVLTYIGVLLGGVLLLTLVYAKMNVRAKSVTATAVPDSSSGGKTNETEND
jgi:UPF0716 family protein affecting phage T7 exclusion